MCQFMNFKKILFVLLAVTIYVPESIAYDINDAVKLALQNSEGLKAQRKKLEITMLSKPKAITGFLPSISANLSHNRYEDKADSLQKTNNYNGLVINIEQEIFAGGGSIAKIAASNASINSAYQEYLESFNDLMLKAVKSYQNVVTSRKIVNVQKENVKMSKKNVEKSRIAVKAGAERKSALLVAKAELS
ncbi:MAG: outer membrane protein, partial [Candidatus Midichloriaceae bacterium]